MDAEIRRVWVEALRSGNYTQGRKRLRQLDDAMCCLGVLWDVTGGTWINNGSGHCAVSHRSHPGPASYSTGYLPNWFRADAGISGYEERELATLNDLEMKDYSQIADWIEENL